MENLKFTAIRIAAIERQLGIGFLNIIREPSITNVAALIQAGTGKSQQEAFDMVDEYIKEKDFLELFERCMSILSEQGFLSREINIQEKIAEAKATVKNS